jgi:hypothetical protein
MRIMTYGAAALAQLGRNGAFVPCLGGIAMGVHPSLRP